MLKLVLVAGMNTRTVKMGPSVLLGAGKWKICTERQKDCILSLSTDDPTFHNGQIVDGYEFTTTKATKVNLGIHIPGTEDYINVFAEMQ